MENKFAVFLVLVIVVECNGHLSILGNILSTAHEKVHSGIEGVAGAVLGRLNIGGHFGINKQNGQPPPQRGRDETIVVVVEENDQNGYRPPNIPTNQRPQGYPEPDYNNQINGPYNNHGHQNTQNPGYQGNGNNFQQGQQEYVPDYNNQNQGSYNNQNNQNPGNQGNHNNFQQRPQEQPAPGYNNQNQFQNTHNPGNQGNENNFNGNPNQNREPQFNDPNYSDGHQFNQNNPKDTKEQQENNGNLNNNNNNPTTENIRNTVAPVPKNEEKNKGTEKSSDDFPLFVPLGPNDYVYGGDKINITAPKRDTEKAKQADDEDLAIDIRFKD